MFSGSFRVMAGLPLLCCAWIRQNLRICTPICDRAWPTYDEEKTIDNEIDIAVQVNGKVRDTIRIKKDSSKEELEELAMNSEVIKKWLEGKEIVKVICVPNRIVNIVIR